MTTENKTLLDIQEQWKKQTCAIEDVGTRELEKKMKKFEKKIASRNFIEIFTCVALIVYFFIQALFAETAWSQAMYLELALSAGIIIYVLRKRGSNIAGPPVGESTRNMVEYQRKQLTRQIQLLSKVRYWYIAPSALGVLGLVGEAAFNEIQKEAFWSTFVLFVIGAIILVVFAFIIWLNEHYTVKKLKAELEQLPVFGD